MNPLEIIENGIVDGNWAMVCRGYEDLTGKIIKTKGISNLPNQLIKQIEELLNDYKKNVILNPVIDIEKCIHTPGRNPPEPKDRRPDPPQPLPMPLVTGSSSNKKGYYGNDTNAITDNNIPLEEINKNIEKAAISKERKTKRNPPKKYNVKCSQCEKIFESDRQESKDFGQKCPKCLQDTINGKISDE
jgi:DNA-directed RNA polymerase subunit RPC12/RpoP